MAFQNLDNDVSSTEYPFTFHPSSALLNSVTEPSGLLIIKPVMVVESRPVKASLTLLVGLLDVSFLLSIILNDIQSIVTPSNIFMIVLRVFLLML